MTAYDPHRSFGLVVHDVARLLRKRFERRAEGACPTRAQWSVLVHLSRQQGINQATLAELMEIEPITLVRLLDRLEAAGIVERRADPADRRARLVYLTDKAERPLAAGAALALEVRREALDGLSPAQVAGLMDMLMHIKGNLLRLEGTRPGDAAAEDRIHA